MMESNNTSAKESTPALLSPKAKPASSAPVKAPRFVQVDPTQLKFQLTESSPIKRTLQLTNVSGLRIAWRIRSNAPTRYIVNPACGFLTQNEAQTITVELESGKGWNDRHRFMVQAMEAKDDEKDRRKIWEEPRATQLELVQCFRVFTIGTGAVWEQSIMSYLSKTLCVAGAAVGIGAAGGGGGAAASTSSSSAGVTTTTSVASSYSSGTSSSSATTSGSSSSVSSSCSGNEVSTASSSSSAASGGSTTSATASSSSSSGSGTSALSEFSARIAELTSLAKTTLAAKEQVHQLMTQAINEVKRVEGELDQAGKESNDLDNRQKALVNEIEVLELKSKALDDELKEALGGKDFTKP